MSHIIIGKAGGRNVALDLGRLIRTRLLIQANSGGGKSWLLRRLAEQLFGKVQVILLDPEGEFATLRERYGYVLIGQGGETPADVRSARLLAEKLLELRASAVCDLYEAFRGRPMDQRAWVRVFLESLVDSPKKLWHPVIVIVDEAHKFCPQESPKGRDMREREIISGCKEAMVSLSTAGRKRGFCAVWATQRLAKVDKDATAELLNRLVGMTIEDVDVERAADLMSVAKADRHEFKTSLKTLDPGHFYAFGRAVSKERILLRVGGIQTTHPEPGASKYLEPPPPPDKVKALLPKLQDLPREAEREAQDRASLRAEVARLKRELTQAKKAASVPQVRQLAPAKIEVKTVPAIKKGELRRLEALVERIGKLQERLSGCSVAIGAEGSRLASAVAMAGQRPLERPAMPPARPAPASAREAVPLPSREAPRPRLAAAKGQDGKSLGRGEHTILVAIAQHRTGVSREQLTVLTGYKRSTRDTYLQRLRERGLVDMGLDGIIATQAGVATLGDGFEPLPTGGALRDYWLGRLPQGERAIFALVVEAYPEPVDREKVSEKTGYARSSRDTYIQRLRSRQLVWEAGRGHIQAAKGLFID